MVDQKERKVTLSYVSLKLQMNPTSLKKSPQFLLVHTHDFEYSKGTFLGPLFTIVNPILIQELTLC